MRLHVGAARAEPGVLAGIGNHRVEALGLVTVTVAGREERQDAQRGDVQPGGVADEHSEPGCAQDAAKVLRPEIRGDAQRAQICGLSQRDLHGPGSGFDPEIHTWLLLLAQTPFHDQAWPGKLAVAESACRYGLLAGADREVGKGEGGGTAA